jgi:hypothetical protein
MVTMLMLASGIAGSVVAQPQNGPRGAGATVSATAHAEDGLTSGTLPLFPSNLTHFIYVVRENHVFDDYLGDCATTINDTCNGGVDYTSQKNHQTDVPFTHELARNYSVFDDMYSSIDPYSSQGHAYLFAANVSGTDACAPGGVEGTGPDTEWGIRNSPNVTAGQCSFKPDNDDEYYHSGGSIFDRMLGPDVGQTNVTVPYLTIGDITLEIANPGCTNAYTTGIPGNLPGDSTAVEHIEGCTNGWWYNASTGSPTMPPAINPTIGIPQELYVCRDYCSTGPNPFLDQYSAYTFTSYVKDYGLPTYSYVRLADDHPGDKCGQSYDTCIQWNDASLKLVVQDIMNATSPYRNNTVIAVTEDDTQNGANGPDHISSGRRLPFIMVASHDVMRSGNPDAADCGLSASDGSCGLVVHQLYNTSNVLAVMERVEMNVNPSVFYKGGVSPDRFQYPMEVNDYLAEQDPLEPLWKCNVPGVPCNTGNFTQVLTSTSISPDPAIAAAGSYFPLVATTLDQNGRPIGGASYSWALSPSSLGNLSAQGGYTVTLTAASSPEKGHLCENATFGGDTLEACVPVEVSGWVVLSSVSLAPAGEIFIPLNGSLNLTASSMGNNSESLTRSTSFVWSTGTSSPVTVSPTTGPKVEVTAGAEPGNATLCVNGTYSGVTLESCDEVQVSNAPPTLTSVTLVPTRTVVPSSKVQFFYAQALDQYLHPISSGITYQWTLNPAGIGEVFPTIGELNDTLLTAAVTNVSWINGSLTVSAFNSNLTLVTQTVNFSVEPQERLSPMSITSFVASPSEVSIGSTTNISVRVSDGIPPYSFSYAGLPGGCESRDAPYILCKPTTEGTFTIDVTVTDTYGKSLQASTTLTVASPPASGSTSQAALLIVFVPLAAMVAVGIIFLLRRRAGSD